MFDITLIQTIGIVIITGAAAVLIARRAQVPAIVAYLFAGLLLGPVLRVLDHSAEASAAHGESAIKVIAEIGIVLLLFLVGLELSLDKIRDVGTVALAAGIGQVVFTAVGGTLLALAVSPPLVMFIVRRAGLTMRSAVEAAHLLAQCGEFSLVIMLLGVERGHVSESVLAAMMMLVVISMSLTPFISTDAMTWRLMHWVPGPRRPSSQATVRDHVLFLGCGTQTRKVLERVLEHKHPVVVVDDDAGVIAGLHQRGIPAIRGDGADYDVLHAAGADAAKVIVSTMRRRHDYERLLKHVRGPKILIRVFAPEEGERIQTLGGTPIVESEMAAEAFLKRLDKDRSASTLR